jgi:hypothetical protein
MNKKLARWALALVVASVGIAGVFGAGSPPPAPRVAPVGSAVQQAAQQGAVSPVTTHIANPAPNSVDAGRAPLQADSNTAPAQSEANDALPHAAAILALCDKNGQRIDFNTPDSGGEPPESSVGLNGTLRVVVRTSDDPNPDTDPKRLELRAGCNGLSLVVMKGAGQVSVAEPRPEATTTAAHEPSKPLGSSPSPEPAQPPTCVSAKNATTVAAAAGETAVCAVPLDVADYALFLDGREIQGLEGTIYNSSAHRFEFQLRRNIDNKALWKRLLGSPKHPYRQVTVALGVKVKDKTTQPTIVGPGKGATFQLRIFSPLWFWLAVGAVVIVFGLVIGNAATTTTLRDALLPQLPPHEQPYSLGRCQMAFWFVLVFASFIFLYVLLWDYDTVSTQALALMGISSATALAAVAVDVVKDSPADAANRALQALGIYTYADVLRMRQEIAFRKPLTPPAQVKAQGAKNTADQAKAVSDFIAADANATQAQKDNAAKAAKDAKDLADAADRNLKTLQAEIQDREIALRTYDDKSRPFRSECWFKDITTDLNGPTVHRLQVVFWTAALGGVFVVGVYRDLAMPPDFSATLLALMGLSGAGYVGFKYPEKNN